jgi:hypothetical protein
VTTNGNGVNGRISPIQEALKTLTRWTVVLYVLLVLVVGVSYVTRVNDLNDVRESAATVNEALCAFRLDLERRVLDTARFLENHPQGIAGIPREQLKTSIQAQRQTVRALRILDCP